VNEVKDPDVKKTEVRLVRRAAAGDNDAQHELFERYRGVAYRVALRISGRAEDALDVVQDSFIRAFDRLGGFQEGAAFKTWLMRIVSNRALDLLRSRKVRRAVPITSDDDGARADPPASGAETDPGHGLESIELAERLNTAIESLSPDQRAVFALYATGELTYGQIAEAVGIPIGTVMSRLYHARRKLHEMLPDLAPKTTEP
jgi:RNA polymerase sigma-70 factor (ECF subfamily)